MSNNVPNHIAIIMDGNGRWAKAKGYPRIIGHKKGAETLRTTLEECKKHGIKYLTIYAFSSENWQRPLVEVTDLMNLLRGFLEKEIATLHKNGVRLRVIGDLTKLDNDIRESIEKSEQLTLRNELFNLTVAISYGARQEITHAAKILAAKVKAGEIDEKDVDESTISSLIYTHDLPDPDLLIRTGGEHRLSNFLLWQAAYTELYFTPILWPDFSVEDLRAAIAEYANRERRYGTTN